MNWKEIAAVLAVGAAAGYLVKKAPLVGTSALAAGAVVYGAGYYAALKRPAGGWPMLTGK